jgi:hypothetical protein
MSLSGGVALGLNEVESGVQLTDASGNVEVEGEDVERVAHPGKYFAAAFEFEPG